MGLLRSSECLKWSQIVKLKEKLKKRGIKQFIEVYKNANSTFKHEFIWGDEIEIMACVLQTNEKDTKESNKNMNCDKECYEPENEKQKNESDKNMNCDKVCNKLQTTNKYKLLLCSEDVITNFKSDFMNLTVEFASYMIESTPAKPHNSDFIDLKKVEECMLFRINTIKDELQKRVNNSFPLLMTCYPKLGKYDSFYNANDNFGDRAKKLEYKVTRSMYFPDNAITDHKRFFSFVRNIINRRGRKVEGYIQIMESENHEVAGNGEKCEVNKNVANSERCEVAANTTAKDNENAECKNNNKRVCLDNSKEADIKINEQESLCTESKNIIDDIHKNKTAIKELLVEEKEDSEFESALENDTKVLQNHIRIDSMGQGMGCCCLQLTLQASEISEARMLYDMLGSLCPLFLRLTRATPLSQGKLLNTETRWDMLVFSVDCRTNEERGCEYKISGEKDIATNEKHSDEKASVNTSDNENMIISKSRFSSIDMFISTDARNLDCYSDLQVKIHQEGYKILKKSGVDEKMAKHVASLFIRDPILVYKNDEKVTLEKKDGEISQQAMGNIPQTDKEAESGHLNTATTSPQIVNEMTSIVNEPTQSPPSDVFFTDDFENIQSSNWRSMRFKLPSQNGNLKESGWKVEVRPMEIQPTAYENSSYCVFVILLSKAIIKYNLNFYMPLSLIDENFRKANLFYNKENEYKENKTPKNTNGDENANSTCSNIKIPKDKAIFYYRENIYDDGIAVIKEGTIEEIFLGTEKYEGIFNVVKKYVKEHGSENDVAKYLDFIEKRCKGDYLSISDFIRKYVINHKMYKSNANASEEVLNDLIDEMKKITQNNNCEHLKNE
ncbi:hypothetical protein BDAP_001672 [Binucleata daphniae]